MNTIDEIVMRHVAVTNYRFRLPTLHIWIRFMNVCSTSHTIWE